MYKFLAVCGAMALFCVAGNAFASDDPCQYGGTTYSSGSAVCQSGTQYKCDDGEWKSLKRACQPGPPLASAIECEFGGRTYSSGSASCQAGSQYRCENGMWRSLGVACNAGTFSGDVPIGPGLRNCLYNGRNFMSGSSLCQTGVQFTCEDGRWRNMGFGCD